MPGFEHAARRVCWACALLLTSVVYAAGEEARKPVLLELFTSEGCSSCPPADELLAKIDREQPIKNLELIVLSEHVDIWNHGGWIDPYSSAAFTARQEHYVSLLRADDLYTPQLIVDGRSQLVGSDWQNIHAVLQDDGAIAAKVPIQLKLIDLGHTKSVEVRISSAGGATAVADVYVAMAADRVGREISGGENRGRHLAHTAVAASVKKIGAVTARSGFAGAVPASPLLDANHTRVVVFVQDPHTGSVLGVAQLKL